MEDESLFSIIERRCDSTKDEKFNREKYKW